MNDVWELIDGERRDLLQFLESLSEGDWNHDSLCDGWRNKEVVAHLNWVATVTVGSVMVPMLRARFNLDKAADRIARRNGRATTTELMEEFAATIGSRHLPPKVQPDALLADLFVHHQDMRRPLGRTRHVDEERLRTVLEATIKASGSRCRGITVSTTDMVFSEGKGPVIEGLTEALIMVISGRKAVLTDLSGPGFAVMAARLAN